jgi:dTMP kinase
MHDSSVKGRLITFEGLDGTGKSTQIRLLAAALTARGIDVVVTREPGGTTLGEEVRKILLDPGRKEMSAHAELALMFACRAQLLREVIEPALDAGRWVLCDRFTDSSEAYQGAGRRLGSAPIHALHRILANDRWPWLTILLNGNLEASLQRARTRNGVAETEGRFEAENAEFFARVHQGFRTLAERESQRVMTINADQSIDSVHQQILAHIDRKLCEEESTLVPDPYVIERDRPVRTCAEHQI